MDDVIKCVLVGDTGVGKTRLICAKVKKEQLKLEKLMGTHIPTVWAQDPLRLYSERIDGMRFNYTIWDTFGEHKNDRCFAYSGANVVLLCYSVVNRKSFENIKRKWYTEVKSFCPTSPVILIACKCDLRYLFCYPEYNELRIAKPNKIRVIQMKDIVTPSEGRDLAIEISAFYLETSVLTRQGVEEAFEYALRLVLLKFKRSKLRFSINSIPVNVPKIQTPYLHPKPSHPKLKTLPLPSLNQDLASAFCCHDNQSKSADLMIRSSENGQFFCHKLMLAVSNKTFYRILTENIKEVIGQKEIFMGLNSDDSENSCLSLIIGVKDKIVINLLHFIYQGELPKDNVEELDIMGLKELKKLALFLCFKNLETFVTNIETKESYLNVVVQGAFLTKRNNRIFEFGFRNGLFSDIAVFPEDGFSIPVHKFILISRCEILKLMFNNEFQETCSSQIKLPGIGNTACVALLYYLYAEKLSKNLQMPDYLVLLELSNRFCLTSLQKRVEIEIVEIINETFLTQLDDLAMIIEHAQLLNAQYLSKWCLYHLSTNYKLLSEITILKLSKSNQDYLNYHQWPPEWYFEECQFYDSQLSKNNSNTNLLKSSKLKHYFNEINCFRTL